MKEGCETENEHQQQPTIVDKKTTLQAKNGGYSILYLHTTLTEVFYQNFLEV